MDSSFSQFSPARGRQESVEQRVQRLEDAMKWVHDTFMMQGNSSAASGGQAPSLRSDDMSFFYFEP